MPAVTPPGGFVISRPSLIRRSIAQALRKAADNSGKPFILQPGSAMVSINNTLINRFAATQQAAKSDPVHLLSNRHAKPLEQTTSESESSRTYSDRPALTYANPAHRAAISSQHVPKESPGAESPPASQFDRMSAVKALVARYKSVTEAGAHLNLSTTGELFDLTIKTKDGDTITLNIGADVFLTNKDGDASLVGESNFSFTVAGELSDKEREAIDSLVGRLSDIAGAYQKDGWADVEFLDVLDGDLIAGLDLSIAGEETKALTITYDVNSDSGTHTLAVNQNDYEYEINAELIRDSTNLSLEKNEVYLQYQQMLIDTTRSYKAGEFSGGVKSMDAAEFFLDGLEAILTPISPDKSDNTNASTPNIEDSLSSTDDTKIANDKRISESDADFEKEKITQRKSVTEKAFLSGIPDFFASFNTPRFAPNASNLGEVSQMSLSMEQVTETSIKPSDGIKTLEQRYSYESSVSQHFGIGRDSVEHANLADADQPGGQTYLYEVVKQAATLTRTLDMDANGKALAYLEEKDSEEVKRSKTVVNGNVTETKEEDLTDSSENYSYALQAINAVTEVPLRAAQIRDYVDIQTLEEVIKSSRVNFYS